jgi:hypothetical protein
MPTISRFYGIDISMYYRDHRLSHFHADYGEHSASIAIESLEILQGRLPRRVQAMVLEWALMHRPELRENWNRLERREPLASIPGLDEEAE